MSLGVDFTRTSFRTEGKLALFKKLPGADWSAWLPCRPRPVAGVTVPKCFPGSFSRSLVWARLCGADGPTHIQDPAGALSLGPVNGLIHPLHLNWSRCISPEGPGQTFLSFHLLIFHAPPTLVMLHFCSGACGGRPHLWPQTTLDGVKVVYNWHY